MNNIQIFHRRFQPAKAVCFFLFVAAVAVLPAVAQINFTSSELPGSPGDYYLEYVTSNADPSALIGSTGGPQQWDFSYPEEQGDIVRRLDIVPPTDGGQQSSFPDATYAERYTDEPTNAIEWDYYALTNLGRIYYGSYVPSAGASTFSPPSCDIPAFVGYGTNWSYTESTTYGIVTEQDTVNATVDAFGTVILPQLGSVQALRVNQVTTTVELYGSEPIATYYLREYYWLSPGFDKAVHIVSQLSDSLTPENFTSASEIRRVFALGPLTTVDGLQIIAKNGAACLTWNNETNVPAYEVQELGDLTTTNWQILAMPGSNTWSDAMTSTQRFYQVFNLP